MDLDELHRPAGAHEDRERGRAQVLALQGPGGSRDGWDRWRSAAAGSAEAVHDVLRVDRGPHDDAQLGELRADIAESFRQGALLRVDLGREREQGVAFGVVPCVFFGTVWQAAIAPRIADVGHVWLPVSRW